MKLSLSLALVGVLVLFVLFFFFQAEDGIRDYDVTGVQTCALPICEAVEILFTGFDQGIQGEEVQYYQRSLTIEEAT